MKRTANLFPRVVAFDNLLLAAKKAVTGKRKNHHISSFLFHIENELIEIQKTLLDRTYRPRLYRTFQVFEPKPRDICCSDIRDRVVHHAICNVVEPMFERRLIYDTYACRNGKGVHKAIQRTQFFSKKNRFFLKCDINKYFEAIDHSVLKTLLLRIFKDKDLLQLLDIIIEHKVPGSQAGRGLPIGNLTSQHFANLYLGELDLFVKNKLRVRGYLRYMDDFILFDKDKTILRQHLGEIDEFLRQSLQLRLKDKVTTIAPVSDGIPYLGFRVFPSLIRIKRQNVVRLRQKIQRRHQQFRDGHISERALAQAVASMLSHIQHANSLGFRRKEVSKLAW